MTGSGKNGTTKPGNVIGATSTNEGDGFSKVTVYGEAKASDFNSGTGKFLAPTDGLYHVQLNVFNNGSDTVGRNMLFVSTGVPGGQYAIFNQKPTIFESSYNWSQMLWVTKGDEIFFQNPTYGTANNVFYYAPSHTNLSIIRIY